MPHKDRDTYNAYMAEYMLKRYYQRKQQAYEILGDICCVCSGNIELEFDHINPKEKSFTIGKLWSVSEKRFLEEIAKCQVLCGICHKNKHKSDAPCGTVARYWAGCRCVGCKAARNKHHAAWRKNRQV